MKYFLTALIITLFLCEVKGQVSFISPSPTGEILNSVMFQGESTVYAIGENRTILKSSDNGTSWENQYANDLGCQTFYDICFINDQVGFIVGDNTTIIKTTDGGESWQEKLYSPYEYLYSISVVEGNFGFAVGSRIFKTINAGETWSLIPNFNNATKYLKVAFINKDEGFIMDARNLSKTTDGGQSWQSIYTITSNAFTTFCCIDFQTIFLGDDNGQIFRTNNCGLSWDVSFSDPEIDIKDIKFVDSQNGYASCGKYILRTHDGGNTWDKKYTGFDKLNNIAFNSTGTGFFVNNQEIFKTVDNGDSWEMLSDGYSENSCFDFKDIFFIDNEIGFIVNADEGCILKTSNGGKTWSSQQTVSGGFFRAISFFDDSTGVAVGDNGIIARTTDTGNTWNIVESNTTNNILDISIGNGNVGYASGVGVLLKTTDGGNHWSNCLTTPYYTAKTYNAVDFINADTGFIITGYEVYKTFNGGQTLLYSYNYGGKDIFFVNGNVGFMTPCNTAGLYKTTNGGVTWTQVQLSTMGINSIWFISQDTGFAVGDKLFITTDGGDSWSTGNVSGYSNLNKVFFNPEGIGFIINQSNEVLKTTDTGKSWFFIKERSADLYDVFFADTYHGYAIGNNRRIKITNDGGLNWVTYSNEAFYSPQKLFFTDSLNGYVIGNKTLIRTTDGGKDWNTIYTNEVTINDVFYLENSKGFIVCNNGVIKSSTDSGYSWTALTSGTQENLTSIDFADNTTGIVAGENGTILRTTDQGNTWTIISEGQDVSYNRVQFTSEFTGYLIGNGGDDGKTVLLKTTDKGLTWNIIKEYDNWFLFQDMFFVDDVSGYILAGDMFEKAIYKTEDSGLNLELIYPYYTFGDDRCKSLFFNTYTNGYVVGLDNTIIRIGSGPILTGVNDPDNSYFSKLMIYPNPATNEFVVKVPDNQFNGEVKINVIDIFGRCIYSSTLEKDQKTKSIVINDHANGLYIVHLSDGKQNLQAKLVYQ